MTPTPPHSAAPAAIRVQNLVVRYGKRVGVDGVNLDVPAGSLFGFLGPNGAGKSTTIRTLLGFLNAHQGSAHIFDDDCQRNSRNIKKYVTYLPGDVRLYPWLTGHRALQMLSAVRHEDVATAGNQLMQQLDLDPTVRVRQMSRGMRQKLGLVMTLAPVSKLIILDEPTSGLDPITQLELGAILRNRAELEGTTVFFSSHTLSEVEQLCDSVAIVRAGRVVESALIRTLQDRALRQVHLQYHTPEAASNAVLPDDLTFVERRSTIVIAAFEGDAPRLLDWLKSHAKHIVDFSITPPDLESLFHQYYKDDHDVAVESTPVAERSTSSLPPKEVAP